MQYERVLCLPESERCLGEVTKIAKSLPIPVTRQCLLRWHAKNDRHEKLRRKEGSGTTCIMDDDPNYRKYELFVYFHNLHIVWCHIIHAFPCHLCCQQVFNSLIIWWNVASLVQRWQNVRQLLLWTGISCPFLVMHWSTGWNAIMSEMWGLDSSSHKLKPTWQHWKSGGQSIRRTTG